MSETMPKGNPAEVIWVVRAPDDGHVVAVGMNVVEAERMAAYRTHCDPYMGTSEVVTLPSAHDAAIVAAAKVYVDAHATFLQRAAASEAEILYWERDHAYNTLNDAVRAKREARG